MSASKRDQARRARFVAYAKARYGPTVDAPRSEARAQLQKKLGVTKGTMTQLFDSDVSFGERKAAGYAASLGLADDYFEQDHSPPPDLASGLGSAGDAASAPIEAKRRREQTDRLLFLWEPLFDVQRERIIQMLQRENAQAREAIDEMKRRGWVNPDIPEDVLPAKFTRPAQRDLPSIVPPTAEINTGAKRPRK